MQSLWGPLSCGQALGRREGRGALEQVGLGPCSETGMFLNLGPSALGAPASLHPVFCEQSSAFTGATWQSVCMETTSFRNSAESLLSQVLVHLIVSAGSIQLFFLRSLSLSTLTGPKRDEEQSLKMTVLTFPSFISLFPSCSLQR